MKTIETHNREFVKSCGYEPFRASKFPKKKLAIVTCMDTRLVTLLPAALGVENGDVIMIKTAGGLVSSPYSDSMRSIIVAVYELGVENIVIMAHTNCGVEGLKWSHLRHLMEEKGVTSDAIEKVKKEGVDIEFWLTGFEEINSAVKESVELVKNHPLLPKGLNVMGYIIDTDTGKLSQV